MKPEEQKIGAGPEVDRLDVPPANQDQTAEVIETACASLSIRRYTITRYRADARRCGLATGPGPAWRWAYEITGPRLERPHHGQRDLLADARSLAAEKAWPYPRKGSAPPASLTEDWRGGKSYTLGPRGGWRPVKAPS